jgi:Asp-tRNA(Asn)/Glu-tRNA(Gln) amidotransferase A subunit family amidase
MVSIKCSPARKRIREIQRDNKSVRSIRATFRTHLFQFSNARFLAPTIPVMQNIGALCIGRTKVDELRRKVTEEMEKRGFKFHEISSI